MQTESLPLIEWKLPPQELHLAPDTVHLWGADLATQTFDEASLQALLSADERQRAARFRFPKDQRQFLVARGLLRLLLGHYLHAEPASLRFDYRAQGKPWLPDAPSLHFNLAHSGTLILYAVSACEVGVDVEEMRVETSEETIAEQFFAPAEVAALRTLPLAQQPQAFFQLWTRKEAFIKARGEGLSFPLNGFAVSLDSPVTLQVYEHPHESERWQLYSLNLKPNYVGALAAEGKRHELQCYSTRALY